MTVVPPVQVPPAAPNPIPAAPAVQMRPVAGPAKLQRRHYGLMLSFGAMVLVPVILCALYLFVLANDQYASRAGFTIRQEDGNTASAILGGLSFLTGGSQGVNAGVLHEFMQSQTMMEQVDARIDLRAHYAQGWPYDPVYSIWPDATTEELFGFWKRVLRLSYDSSSGLIDLTVQALDPDTAQNIAMVILETSQTMINQLNDTARREALANADRELADAVESLRVARGALTVFRAQTRIVDPIADIQGRLGVVSNLQQQLAQALVELDLLDPSTRVDDPRRAQLERRITVIRDRIDQERNFFGATTDLSDSTYPEMIAQYEGLSVDLEFAQRNYTAALAARQAAVSNANRQSLYLAAYIPPTKAQDAEFPRRFILLSMILGFLLMAWATAALIYYSLRDRG
ncbi:MAG: sugar transporter [Pseudotabrizicola sp.]|uniref:sugar transporter n=1 Tax=Pseudotabrizicola sp. TaxID=2939647 RepID=UPI002726DBBE|nr:sugar transporter [Pseudotabrizicola sp.]MDO9637553.1 sugar transporter [Pseudotabrizicola sp.]